MLCSPGPGDRIPRAAPPPDLVRPASAAREILDCPRRPTLPTAGGVAYRGPSRPGSWALPAAPGQQGRHHRRLERTVLVVREAVLMTRIEHEVRHVRGEQLQATERYRSGAVALEDVRDVRVVVGGGLDLRRIQ